MYASGDIQTTTMTLHIANKEGGGTLGTEIFSNVNYSTSEEKTLPHRHQSRRNIGHKKSLLWKRLDVQFMHKVFKKYIVARLHRYCNIVQV